MLKFVVIGTYRGGTLFVATTLQALGINCGHEAVFREEYADLPRISTDHLEADCGGAAWRHIALFETLGLPVVRLVREKSLVMASLKRRGGPIKDNISRYYDEVHHAAIQAKPCVTMYLENSSPGFLALSMYLGLGWTEPDVQTAMRGANRNH